LARHLAEEKMHAGILFVIFAIQSPTRLDKFIRENLDLTIYKTYYPMLDKELNPDDVEYIKNFTEDAMVRHKFEARGSGLGKTRTGNVIRLYFPKKKAPIDIPWVFPEPSKDILELEKEFEKQDLIAVPDRVLKGLILEFCEKHEINLNMGEIYKSVYKICYHQYVEGVKKAAEEKQKDEEKKEKDLASENDISNALIENFDLEFEDKVIVRGFFIKYCRQHKIDYNNLDYNAIYHIAVYQQKQDNTRKAITNPDALSLQILKFREYISHCVLGIKLDDIAEIDGISQSGVSTRKKKQEKELFRFKSKKSPLKKSDKSVKSI
jgi:hypothetical protein